MWFWTPRVKSKMANKKYFYSMSIYLIIASALYNCIWTHKVKTYSLITTPSEVWNISKRMKIVLFILVIVIELLYFIIVLYREQYVYPSVGNISFGIKYFAYYDITVLRNYREKHLIQWVKIMNLILFMGMLFQVGCKMRKSVGGHLSIVDQTNIQNLVV